MLVPTLKAADGPKAMPDREGVEPLEGPVPRGNVHGLTRRTVDDGCVDSLGSRALTATRPAGAHLDTAPFWKGFGAAMSSSPWEWLWNGDEDVASPFLRGPDAAPARNGLTTSALPGRLA
jgi:hypothetical protein